MNAWEGYLWWQSQDRKALRRINAWIAHALRNGNAAIGRAESLRRDLAGYWLPRITDQHRLVYKVVAGELRIATCRYRYGV